MLILFSCGENDGNSPNLQIIQTQTDTTILLNKPTIIFDKVLETGWYYLVDTANGYKRQLDKTSEYYFLNPIPIAKSKDFTTLEIYKSTHGDDYGLTMRLNDTGTKAWSEATGKSVGNKLAFILDDKLLFTAVVNSQIDFGVTALNRGDISKEELERIKAIIENEMK